MAGARLHFRQASATPTTSPSSTTTAKQPTVTIALSTTFTPPASCASNRVTILPPSALYFMWANDPVPYANKTISDCYPSEFLKSYTSISAGETGSSIVPVMSPLVCPKNFCTMFAGDNNYIACCPSGYKFEGPKTDPVDSNRPAYGGTCYSGFTLSSTLTALKYDSDGSTATIPWWASSTGANAYAHPIDGFAPSSASVGCPANPSSLSSLHSNSASSSTSSSTSSSSTPTTITTVSPTPVSTSISPGAIAGIALGSVAGLATLITLIFLAMRRRRRRPNNTNATLGKDRSESSEQIHQLDDGLAFAKPAEFDVQGTRHEKDSKVAAVEIDGEARGEVYEMSGRGVGDRDGTHELPVWREEARK